MKLKYLFPSLIAAVTMLVSCSDDNDPTYLDEIRVSSSYVALSVDGGSTSIEISANGDWAVDTVGLPKWLEISPLSGSAGESVITFSAESTLDGRTAELKINCSGKTQIINVIQGIAEVSPATCAEVIAGPDSKQYRVTGTVTSIANTIYGNWYLTDETGTVYIYGTLDEKGNEKNFESLGIDVGDIVTVEGPKTTYGTTVELVNVTVVNIEKSLIKVDSLDIENNQLPVEGGDFTVSLTCKTSNGVSVEIPADAQSWLSIVAINGSATPTVKFHAVPNAGGDRETTIVFTTTDGKKTYSSEIGVVQKGDFVLFESMAYFNSLADDATTNHKISGVITQIANTTYGNMYIADATGEVYVYGTLTADGQSKQFDTLGLEVGDVVTLNGPKGSHNGSPQMVNGVYQQHIRMPGGVTPISIADFCNLPDDDKNYYLLIGNVDEIANTKYGNFYMSDETGSVYIYGTLTADQQSGQFANLGIKQKDTVVLIGQKTVYGTTVEAVDAIYVSHASAE